MSLIRPCGRPVLVVLAVLVALSNAAAQDAASLDTGWQMLYSLDFRSADRVFQEWQREHPRDPFGPMSAASNLLFEELDRKGVLQAQFFVNDSSFVANATAAPDRLLHERFEGALAEAEALSQRVLAADPRDHDALFALAMVHGLRADYAALIAGQNMAFLSNSRKAAVLAGTLLELAPDYADAHLAAGVSQYVVGSLVAPLRWLLRLGGYTGDRVKGMEEVGITAAHGRFLGPFARILLAIACLRADDSAGARALLAGLARDFPSNTLFAREIRRLDGAGR